MYGFYSDVYDGTEQSIEVNKLFVRLAERLKEEEQLTEDLLGLQGALQLLLSGASVGENDTSNVKDVATIQPSVNAQSNFVVNIT